METVFGTNSSIAVWGYVADGILYAVAFLMVLHHNLEKPDSRNIFSVSLTVLFALLFFGFILQGFFGVTWPQPTFQIAWQVVVGLPALLFVGLRLAKRFPLDDEEIQAQRNRFDKLKDEFLSVASHELRTPLSIINGFAEILVREKLGTLNDEQKRRVRKILMQGQRLTSIIDSLLDLSRIRSGKIDCRKDVFDLVPVLKSCVDDHRILCEQQQIELIDEVPDIIPDVVADIERITQVVVNLLNNAIKYTEPGGKVTLTASYDKEGQQIYVNVLDSGIGLNEHDREHVFEEFYRAYHRDGKKYVGTGLGLTIVRQLVETQGGKVGVKSEGLGKGSDFFFTIPAATDGLQKSSYVTRSLIAEKQS
ncbi:MAG: HAMP domain-containing sensor histidine kinase [Candidatus Omnitrophota bacterium]|nr:HAMP domain-containing sensor histidine kinase [Candidatus Omnitrophota bacterium]